jgi:hypothetical protein
MACERLFRVVVIVLPVAARIYLKVATVRKMFNIQTVTYG